MNGASAGAGNLSLELGDDHRVHSLGTYALLCMYITVRYMVMSCPDCPSRKDLLPTVERVISKQSPAVCSFQPWRVALSTSCPSQDSPGPELSVIKTHSLRLSDGPKVPARLTGVLSGERSLFPQVHPASFLSFHQF